MKVSREKNRESCKRWRENNREQYNKIKRIWAYKKYHTNKDFRIEYNKKVKEKYKKDLEYRKKRLEYFKKWYNNNKDKYNIYSKNEYKKNPNKWNCRTSTYNILKKISIPKKCKICNSIENIEIHHEIYPSSLEGIKSAIKKEKIYYLCIRHHRKKHSSSNKI